MINFAYRCLIVVLAILAPAPASAERLVLAFVGDIMLAGSGSMTFAREGYDYPFAATGYVLKDADIAIGNLEAPLARGGSEFTGKKFRFKVNPEASAAIRKAGFSVVTLANNHIMDFGAQGLRETEENLSRHGILFTGAGATLAAAREPAIVTKKGKKVAFLAYSLTQPVEFYAGGKHAGTAPGYPRYFREDICKARAAADYVVVSFHWGAELDRIPKPYQVNVARQAVDAGADLVVGHHPHVLQGIERYREGIILYSLGNYVFGSMSRHADSSVMAKVVLDGGVKEVELLPLDVLNSRVRFKPVVMKGKQGSMVVFRLAELSRQWKTQLVADGGRFLVKMEAPAIGPVFH